jgi:hypothetical protein
MHFAVKIPFCVSKCVTKSLFIYEKIIEMCKFFLNIVTTKMTQKITEGTFSRGVPHIYTALTLYSINMGFNVWVTSVDPSVSSDLNLHWWLLGQKSPNEYECDLWIIIHYSWNHPDLEKCKSTYIKTSVLHSGWSVYYLHILWFYWWKLFIYKFLKSQQNVWITIFNMVSILLNFFRLILV